MRATFRTGLRVLAVAGLALLLSGCIQAHQILTINADDTVDGTFTIGVSKELVEMSGQDPGAMLDEITSGDSPLPEGIDFETKDYDDGEYVGQEFTFAGVSLEAFNENGEITIKRDGDEFVVDGSADMSDPGEGVDLNDPTTQQLMESFDVKVQVTFPGAVTESNGVEDGNTVSWTPSLGEVNEIHAVGSAIASGGDRSLIWIMLAGSIIVIGLIVFFVRKSSMSGGLTEEEIAEGTPEAPAVPPAAAEATPATDMPPTPTAPEGAPDATQESAPAEAADASPAAPVAPPAPQPPAEETAPDVPATPETPPAPESPGPPDDADTAG